MRVLLTTDTVGGVWTYTRELTEGLLERSHAVALVSFGRLPSREQQAWCSETSSRYPGHFRYLASETPLEWMQNNQTAYSGAEDLLLQVARSFRAELLHSNQFCFGKLPLSLPKLVVAHSDVLSWAAACKPDGLDPSPWLTAYRSLVQDGLSSADAVVAPTHWMLQAISGRFSLPRETRVIPNGRDISPPAHELDRKLQAVSVGRLWDEAKGVALLSEVASPFPLYVVGEIQHEAVRVTPDLGNAVLLGALDDGALVDLLRSSSIYLMLSIYEPFGLAPLEAALCGCAILSRDISSLREIWGDAALYFREARELTSLLNDLARDPDLLLRMQKRASVRAGEMNRTRMTELYVELYSHLLEPPRSLHSEQTSTEVASLVS